VKRVYGLILGALIELASLAHPPLAGVSSEAFAHGAHEHFAAGEPGDPKKPFRIVKVTMLEDGKTMLFEPAVVEVRLGEQVRFEIFNEDSCWRPKRPIENTPN
jgi:plastocyanin